MRRLSVRKPAAWGKTEARLDESDAYSHWCNLTILNRRQHRALPYAISLAIAGWREAARASSASPTAEA